MTLTGAQFYPVNGATADGERKKRNNHEKRPHFESVWLRQNKTKGNQNKRKLGSEQKEIALYVEAVCVVNTVQRAWPDWWVFSV